MNLTGAIATEELIGVALGFAVVEIIWIAFFFHPIAFIS